MSDVIVDTGPLVALLEPRDAHHLRARTELKRLRRHRLLVCLPVLSEALFFLEQPHLRARLFALLDEGALTFIPTETEAAVSASRGFLARYAEHVPDLADAWLASWAVRERLAVWTFDSEFRTTWRSPAGAKLRLLP